MQNPNYQRKCEEPGCRNPASNIHHKDRNRKNNTKDNLVYLCPSCHSKEHPSNVRARSFDMVDYLHPHRIGDRLRTGFNMLNEDYS